MPITQITTDITGLVSVFPRLIYINTNDALSTILADGYLNKSVQEGFVFYDGDMAIVGIKPSLYESPLSALLNVNYADGDWSLIVPPSDGAVEPGDINDLAYYPGTAATVGPIATANSATLRTNSSGVPGYSPAMTNGQILIGATGGTPLPATITAGAGISISNTANSISISASGSGSWVNQTTSSVTMSVNVGYTINAGASLVTLTLPATSTYGDSLEINGMSSGGWKVAQQGGQSIRIGSVVSTVGVTGYIASSNQYDSIFLRCIVPNSEWSVVDQQSLGLTYV